MSRPSSSALAHSAQKPAASPQQRAPQPPRVTPPASVPARDTAALVVQNRLVFVFRAPLGARTAADRAADAKRRIDLLAEQGDTTAITTHPIPEGVLLEAGSRGLFAITTADVDSIAGETLPSTSATAVQRVTAALTAERQQRSLLHLLTGAGLALLATIAFVIGARLLWRARRIALVRISRMARPRVPRISVAGYSLIDADQIIAVLRRLLIVLSWTIALVAAYVWLTYVLTRFPYSTPWGEALGAYLTTTLKQLALGVLGGIPGLFTVVIIFFATRFVTRIVSSFFRAVEAGDVTVPWMHRDIAQPTRRLVGALLWVFAIVVAYPYLPGSSSDIFKGVTVFLGLVLSFGSTGVVNQAMSGLVLMYARAFKVGDYVRVHDIEGTVIDLGLLSTKFLTYRREEITVPNAVMVATTTMNYSRATGDGIILHTSVTIGYDTPWRQVHAMLVQAAERTAGLRRHPPPFVRQTALSDFFVEYQLNAVLEQPEARLAVLSELHANVQDSFNEHGVQIMSPHYRADPAVAKVVPPDQWYSPPASRPAAPVGLPLETTRTTQGQPADS